MAFSDQLRKQATAGTSTVPVYTGAAQTRGYLPELKPENYLNNPMIQGLQTQLKESRARGGQALQGRLAMSNPYGGSATANRAQALYSRGTQSDLNNLSSGLAMQLMEQERLRREKDWERQYMLSKDQEARNDRNNISWKDILGAVSGGLGAFLGR